eukprot:1601205-Rhodomonas_salina.1
MDSIRLQKRTSPPDFRRCTSACVSSDTDFGAAHCGSEQAYAQAVQGDMATMLMGGEPPASEAQEQPADPPAPVVKDKRFYWSSDEAAKVRFETSEPLFSAIEWDQDDKVLQLLADGVDVNAFGSDCA